MGPCSSWTRRYQPQAPEILRGWTVWDHGACFQPEPQAERGTTALEDLLLGSSAQETARWGPQQLQAGGSHVTHDEDTGETDPGPPPLWGELRDGFTTVRLPTWNRGGGGCDLPATSCPDSPGEIWQRFEDYVLWLQRIQCHSAGACEGPAGAGWCGCAPGRMDPHK